MLQFKRGGGQFNILSSNKGGGSLRNMSLVTCGEETMFLSVFCPQEHEEST